jgi:hypothetical protein
MPHHNYFVPDQNNPGVATMNTNQHAAPQHQYHPQVPRQGERLPLEIPSYPNASDLASSIPNSSPGSFSAASGRSPSTQDGFYTHVPAGQTAAYSLHAASPVTQQGPQMMGFQGQLPPSQQQQAQAAAAAAAQQVMTHAAAQQQPQQQQQQPQQQHQQQHQQQQASQAGPPEQYPHQHQHRQHQQQPPHAQQQAAQQQQQQQQQQQAPPPPQQWYDSAPYQSPVEVATIGALPPFGAGGLYDPWGPKLEFDDPTMQLPSARIESM